MESKEGFVDRTIRRSITAAAEACFPENTFGAPDWKQTQMVERTVAYMAILPPRGRLLLSVLYLGLEFGAPFLLAGLLPFSWLSVRARQRAIERWKNSDFILFKTIYDGLGAQQKMMYFSHGAVQRHIGTFKTCERTVDAYGIEVRKDYFDTPAVRALVEEAQ